MSSCRTCLHRALVSLTVDLPIRQTPSILPLPTPIPRLRTVQRQLLTHHGRSASTIHGLRQGHHRRAVVNALTKKGGLPAPNARRNKALRTKVERRDDAARENNAKHLANPDYQKKLDVQAEKEAHYLVDPMRLADEVQRNLRNDHFDKAVALVRASEKQGLKDGKVAGTVNNTVSWNHLCDWCMAQHDPKTALKIYNEMKKRGHRPDAHTYTIMLRGFGENIRKPNAVSDAMKVYNSMFEINSKAKPNTIHTNSIISVCAKGSKMDELWSVAGRLPDRGPGGADHVTFTTILKAIERDAIARAARYMAQEGEGADSGDIFEEAVEDGRKLWRDVIVKWRRADLKIDESLVCAMGRLLLLSKRRNDVMDVFKLVEQTMDVRLQTGAEDAETSNAADGSLTVFKAVPAEQLPATENGAADASNGPLSVYVQPGNNTLSMLMEAALLTKQPHVGKGYWNRLTSPNREFHLEPDANNVVAYLRLLRFSRASADVVELLQREWPAEMAEELNRRGTYVIAMSTCVRDKNNPNIFKIAGKIVDIMQSKLTASSGSKHDVDDVEDEDDEDWEDDNDVPDQRGTLDLDPKVMAMYLNLAMFTTAGINPRIPLKKLPNGDLNFDREPGKNNTMRALHRMGPDAINLKRLLKMKLAEMDAAALNKQHGDRRRMYTPRNQKYGNTAATASETMEDLLGLVRSMIGAYDRILATSFRLEERGLGPLRKDILVESRLQKAKLAAYLGKIDKKYLVGDGKGGRTGLWEGYDPAAKGTFEKPGRTEEGEETAEEDQASDGVDRDYFLKRTVSGARLKKAVKMEERIIEKDREMKSGEWKRLSRRQTQEQEKERREERVRVLRSHDVKARGSRPERAVRTETGERVSRVERVPRAERSDRPARSDQAWERPSDRSNDSFEPGSNTRNFDRDRSNNSFESRRSNRDNNREGSNSGFDKRRSSDSFEGRQSSRGFDQERGSSSFERRRTNTSFEKGSNSSPSFEGRSRPGGLDRSNRSGGFERRRTSGDRSSIRGDGPSKRYDSRPSSNDKRGVRSGLVQQGWGQGFERAAEQMGMKGKHGLVELGR